jgi:hypothetical protein
MYYYNTLRLFLCNNIVNDRLTRLYHLVKYFEQQIGGRLVADQLRRRLLSADVMLTLAIRK